MAELSIWYEGTRCPSQSRAVEPLVIAGRYFSSRTIIKDQPLSNNVCNDAADLDWRGIRGRFLGWSKGDQGP